MKKILKKALLISGILSSILFISTIIFAKEDASSLFEGFSFPTGTVAKKFITESFEELFNTFGNYSKLTEPEKNDSWNKYKGKYVRWTGVVNYKGLSSDDWNRVGIRHNVGTNVELIFGNCNKSIVNMVSKGDHITYTGKLSDLYNRNLLFKLKEANIEIINDINTDELVSKMKEGVSMSLSSSYTSETSDDDLDLQESPDGTNILTYEGLSKVFGSNSSVSQSEKEELWNYYSGKTIEWRGIVNYKGLGRNDWSRIGIRHNVGTNVELSFDEYNRNLIKMLKREDEITYTGKLAKLFGRNLLCSIEDVDIKKIGDRDVAEIKRAALAFSSSTSDTDDTTEEEVIKEPEITMPEAMTPEVVKREDVEVKETIDGLIETSFEELDALFGKKNRMTESQKDKLWREYQDKYIRGKGEVRSRGKGRVSGLRMGIKNLEGTDVELVFTDDKEDLVLGTDNGDRVTYTGKLITRRGYILPYKLEDGNIEDVIKKPEPIE